MWRGWITGCFFIPTDVVVAQMTKTARRHAFSSSRYPLLQSFQHADYILELAEESKVKFFGIRCLANNYNPFFITLSLLMMKFPSSVETDFATTGKAWSKRNSRDTETLSTGLLVCICTLQCGGTGWTRGLSSSQSVLRLFPAAGNRPDRFIHFALSYK